MNGEQSAPKQNKQKGSLLLLVLVLGGALAVLCHEAFLPHRVHWANDVPLGAMLDSSDRLPGTFAGHWTPLYWIGGATPSSSPSFSTLLQTILPPTIFLKVYLPFSMFFLGFGAWLFFRELGFARGVCVVGGLGAGLNMHFFSNGTWGLGNWAMSAGMVLVSLAVIVSPSIRPLWVKAILAGLSVGMVVMEGYDVGAILTLYVGVFIVFYFLTTAPNPVKGIPKTISMGTLIVLFSLFISGSTLYTLVGTQIKGVANVGQSDEEKKAHWTFLTQWSFPKLETLRLVIPGLFGYRLQDYITDTNHASVYWGRIGEDLHVDELENSNPETRAHSAASLGLQPDIQNAMASDNMSARDQIMDQIMDQIKARLQRRHTGSGDYTGELVCLLAVFGLCNSWRKLTSPFSKNERQAVWFWGVAALISLLAAWGRYASLYQFIARLPFLGNIRNAIKFLHPLNICLIILSGYGLEALHRRYLSGAINRAGLMAWWRKAAGFEKKWTIGTLLVLGASIIGLLLLNSSKSDLVHYLQHNGFPEDQVPQQASQMAAFCIKEVALFVVFFAASAGIIIGILSGAWSGSRATWAWVFLGAIMMFDIGRADAPWVRYYDYTKVYSMNPVVDFLRQKPWEHRVMSRLSPTGAYDIAGDGGLGGLCHWWLENDYLANDIESLEIDQAPRLPELERYYIGNFMLRSQQDLSPPVRLWRLTNTRYILADARITDALNQMAQPRNSFRNVMLMDLVLKPGVKEFHDNGDVTVQTNDTGHVALIEFTQALPRAKLYSNWQMTDDGTALAKLNTPEFDPAKTVLIATNTPVAETPVHPEADPGTVTITSYESRDVKLQADAKTPAVLLLNDRTGDYWTVYVDDKPVSILRCNYIMRGVFMPPGQHTIEFRFRAPLQWLYVSLSAFAIGVLLTGYVIFSRRAPASA